MSKFIQKIRSTGRKFMRLKDTFITKNKSVEDNQSIYAKWSASKFTERNLGDSLNPAVIRYITNRNAYNIENVWLSGNNPIYFFMGSTLDNLHHKHSIVCGAGFKSSSSRIYTIPKVLAVRGPKTRDVFISQGVHCPEVYCDPGLFVSDMFPQEILRDVGPRIGIIAHYVDKEMLANLIIEPGGLEYVFLDIESDPELFFKELVSCNYVASSSLHGLIFSISYGIPCVRLVLSNKLLGGDFKFDDFFESLGIKKHPVLYVDSKLELQHIVNSVVLASGEINKQSYLKAMELF